MALLDNILSNGTIAVPTPPSEAYVTDSAQPIPNNAEENSADGGVKKLPQSVKAASAEGKVIKLPNADNYNPNSTDGIYRPTAKDVLGKMIGIADARQFLKTYDFTRDPSKALFLANLAQEIIFGVLPKNRVPSHQIVKEDPGFLGKLAKEAVGKLKQAANAATGGLVSTIESFLRKPVMRTQLTHQELYGTGIELGPVRMRNTNGDDPWARAGGYEGLIISEGAPKAVELKDTPMGNQFGDNWPTRLTYQGDTLTLLDHKKRDVFSDGNGSTDTISGGIKNGSTSGNDDKGNDNGLKANFNTLYGDIKPYTTIKGPYGEMINSTSPADTVKQVISVLGCAVGYRKWFGFEPGSNHMWDVQIYPYNGPSDAGQGAGAVGPLTEAPDGSFTVTPALPTYTLPSLDSIEGTGESFSFGTHCPVLSYTLQFGAQKSKDLPLFNGDAIHMPMGFGYEMIMSLNVLDDVYGSFANWMAQYMNAMYDITSGKVARYDQAAVILRLIVFKNGYSPKYEFRFIAVPYNYSPQIEGDNAPNETQVHVDFHIIGIKKGMTGKTVENDPRNTSAPAWTDVVLAPRKAD